MGFHSRLCTLVGGMGLGGYATVVQTRQTKCFVFILTSFFSNCEKRKKKKKHLWFVIRTKFQKTTLHFLVNITVTENVHKCWEEPGHFKRFFTL